MEARLSRARAAGSLVVELKSFRRRNDASDGDSQSRQEFGSGHSTDPGDKGNVCRHGEVQRGAGKGRGNARRRGASTELEGQESEIFRTAAHGDRRPIY